MTVDILQKVDAVTKIGEDRIEAGGAQDAPKSVKIEITGRCNLRCSYCALHTRKNQPTEDMDFEFFRKITTDMKDSGVEEIGLFYLGESFLAPDLLVECIEWCKGLGFEWVFLTSNATKANPGIVERVMEAGLDSLKWSANFGSGEQFTKVTGSPWMFFKNALFNIQRAYEIREHRGFKTLLSASSIVGDGISGEEMEVFLGDKIAPWVDKHYWLPVYQMGMPNSAIKNLSPTQGNSGRIEDKTGEANRDPLPCWAVFTEGHVRVDGGLSACCFGSDKRFDMGKLDGKNFMSQWNSAEFQHLRRAHIDSIEHGEKSLLDTPCRICVAYE